MMLKRTLAVVFCMMLMVSCLLIPASAASASNANIIVVADKTEVNAGDTVTFSVVLTNADATPEGVYSYDAKIAISGGLTLIEGSVKAVANEGFYAPVFNSDLRCMSTGYNAEGNGGKGYNKGNLTLGTFQCKVEAEGTATVSGVVFTENGYSEELGIVVNVVTTGVGGSETVTTICGHKNTEWVVTTKPTCTEKGVESLICKDCEAVLETRELAALGHSWGEWIFEADATCVDDGKKYHECSVCGEKEYEVIPATGVHTWGEWETKVSASCTERGEEVRKCSVCGKEETRYIDPHGHDYEPFKTELCDEHSTAEKQCTIQWYKCKHCGHMYGEHSLDDKIPNTGDFTIALGMVVIIAAMTPCLVVSKFRTVK